MEKFLRVSVDCTPKIVGDRQNIDKTMQSAMAPGK